MATNGGESPEPEPLAFHDVMGKNLKKEVGSGGRKVKRGEKVKGLVLNDAIAFSSRSIQPGEKIFVRVSYSSVELDMAMDMLFAGVTTINPVFKHPPHSSSIWRKWTNGHYLVQDVPLKYVVRQFIYFELKKDGRLVVGSSALGEKVLLHVIHTSKNYWIFWDLKGTSTGLEIIHSTKKFHFDYVDPREELNIFYDGPMKKALAWYPDLDMTNFEEFNSKVPETNVVVNGATAEGIEGTNKNRYAFRNKKFFPGETVVICIEKSISADVNDSLAFGVVCPEFDDSNKFLAWNYVSWKVESAQEGDILGFTFTSENQLLVQKNNESPEVFDELPMKLPCYEQFFELYGTASKIVLLGCVYPIMQID